MNQKILHIGHSPDPDDAFMFYGLASGKTALPGWRVEHFLEDIQSLNERAMRSELEVTAISAHAFPYVADNYWIMRTGASMGEGYGPVIISRTCKSLDDLRGKTVATPGPLTTATLLFRIFVDGVQHRNMPFDKIMDAVDSGDVDAGLIIHEGQLTYAALGYTKILDFGEFWKDKTGGLPLPLGLDVVRKDLGREVAKNLSQALRDSIEYGYKNLDEAVTYAMQWGRGIDRSLGERFVKMYVSNLTIDMGDAGKQAVELLFRWGFEKGIIPKVPEIDLV